MSIDSLTRVLAHSRSRGHDRLVLLAIAAHDGPGGSWPSIASLAAKANCGETRVRKALTTLTELGEVRVLRNGGGNEHTRADRRPNRYILTLTCPADCDGTTQHRSRESEPVAVAERGGAVRTPRTGGESDADRIVEQTWRPHAHRSAQTPAQVRSVVVNALRNGCDAHAVTAAVAALAEAGKTIAGWSLTQAMNPGATTSPGRRIDPDRPGYGNLSREEMYYEDL